MAGTSQSNLRSAFVAETTAGTTPSTPGFSTTHNPLEMVAKPEIFEQTSLARGGSVADIGITGIPVSGKFSGAMTYGTMDAFLASLMQGAWSSNVLKDGKTSAYFTIENTFDAGAGGTATMSRFTGVQPTGGKILLSSGAEVQTEFDLLGMGAVAATTTSITGATYSDPTNSVPMTSGIDVGAITMAGYTPGGFQSAEIDFAFDGRDIQKLANGLDAGGITLGAFRPKITATAFVDASFAAIYNAALGAQTAFATTFNLGSVSGNKYTILFPACKFADGGIDLTSGELLQKIEIIPTATSATSGSVTITRAVS